MEGGDYICRGSSILSELSSHSDLKLTSPMSQHASLLMDEEESKSTSSVALSRSHLSGFLLVACSEAASGGGVVLV
eukprot:336828-Amphidinium_carterae.1